MFLFFSDAKFIKSNIPLRAYIVYKFRHSKSLACEICQFHSVPSRYKDKARLESKVPKPIVELPGYVFLLNFNGAWICNEGPVEQLKLPWNLDELRRG